ncbi:MAG: hypothetical protein AB7I01_11025 [Gammaproteobacteria bacterium]
MKFQTCLLGLAALGASATAVADTAYSTDFQGGVGAEWSISTFGGLGLDVAPADANRLFLGRNDGVNLGFSNDVVTLNLGGLAAHDKVTVSFDVYVINSWDGNGPLGNFCCGPDMFGVSLADVTPGSATGLLTTFSNINASERPEVGATGALQSYPQPFPNLPGSPAFSGALEVGTLGYDFFLDGGGPGDDDSVYRISLTFDHTDSNLSLSFFGVGLQELTDESWGLDNVSVSLSAPAPVPLPAPALLLGSALLGLGALRRRA